MKSQLQNQISPVPHVPLQQGGMLQRKCACGQHTLGGECGECGRQRRQRSGFSPSEPNRVPSIVNEVLRSPGQPLDSQTRANMETRLDSQPSVSSASEAERKAEASSTTVRAASRKNVSYDFANVRVHTERRAAESARAVDAKAYTVGHDIVFGEGYYTPLTASGQNLIAHELTHVVQQSRNGPTLARAPLDLKQVDRELFWGDPLTQDRGEIGFGATPTSPDGDSKYPIEAVVYPRNTINPMPPFKPLPAKPAGGTGTPPKTKTPPAAKPETKSETKSETKPAEEEDTRFRPGPDYKPEERRVRTDRPKESQWRFIKEGLLVPARRAVVVAAIHGDERGSLDLVDQLQSELSAGTNPLARDFDTIVIPRANPGGIAKKQRENLMGVDLNRNFPGLKGFPPFKAGPGLSTTRQPEVKAIMKVVETIKPDRILSLHGITEEKDGSKPKREKGGVYADTVEDDVGRELACRMALRMRGAKDENVGGNKLSANICAVRYPETSAVSVTEDQSSLGAWASAPTSIGGKDTTVITHEVSEKRSLAATGKGRSVETIMPGIREFLLDNEVLPSEADALLRSAISDAFLTGETKSPADLKTRGEIVSAVRKRFDDMNAFYKDAFLPRQTADMKKVLPAQLKVNNDFRSFGTQDTIASGALGKEALFKSASTDDEIQQAILNVMKTISLPGFSRHAWGTEIDLDPPVRKEWEGAGKRVPLIPFLTTEAPKFGFYHPYSDKRLSATLPHYENEPWHLSYWSFANALQAEYMKRITGTVLENLIGRTAKAIKGGIDEKRLKKILMGMNLTSFHSNVAPPPKQ
jgi:hypothetical protein